MSDVIATKVTKTGNKYELRARLRGTKQEWHSMVQIERNGVPLVNEHGGYNNVRVGSPKYIRQHWNSIRV